jgi:tetratricopeptide (TPR) repeat protein
MLLLLLAVGTLYGWTIGYNFVWDDFLLLDTVTAQAKEGGMGGFFSSEFKLGSQGPSLGYYRPLVTLSLYLDGTLSGFTPWLFHLCNVLMYGITVLLVFILILWMGRTPWIAFACALLFAVHPVHVESVAFVSGRTDLMAGMFLFAMLAVWLYGRERPSRSPGPSVFFLLCALAAFLSKEVALAFSFLLPFWAVLDRREHSPKEFWIAHRWWIIPWGLAMGLYAVMRFQIAQVGSPGAHGTNADEIHIGAADPAQVPLILMHYLRLLVLPSPLRPYYTPAELTFSAPAFIGSLACLGVWGVLLHRREYRLFSLSAAIIILSLIPVMGIIPLRGATLAERFLLLPSFGFILAVSGLLDLTSKTERAKRAAVGILLCVLPVFGILTLFQSAVWKDNLRLFQFMTQGSPTSPHAFVNLGVAHQERGQFAEAESAYEKALRLSPTRADAWTNLGVVRQKLGKIGPALDAFLRALQSNPGSSMGHDNIGLLQEQSGRLEAARDSYQKALALDPSLGEAYKHLGRVQAKLKDWKGALAAYARALDFFPRDADFHFEISRCLIQLGRHDDAIRAALKALELRPDHGDALLVLGTLYARQKEWGNAAPPLEKLLSLNPRHEAAWNTLCFIYTQAGRTDRAIYACTSAIALDPRHPGNLFNLGRSFARAGDRRRAQAACDALRQRDARLADDLLARIKAMR